MKGGDPLPRAASVLPARFLRDALSARDQQNFRKK